jgi:hypothetical protein
MPRITGRVEVLANGVLLLSKSGATANGIGVSGYPAIERRVVMGTSGIHGFVEEPVEASCEVTLTDRDDVSLSQLAAIEGDGTIIFRTYGGGKVYTLANATCVSNLKLTGGEGEVPLKFIGPSWTESTNET